MSRRIKGIVIEIEGETKGLDKALQGVNKSSREIQKELRDVDRLLRFNPKNTELLAQKQKLLAQQVGNTKQKLDQLKAAQQQVNQQFKEGKISEGQYRAFQREIAETESKLKHYEGQLKQVDSSHRSFGEKMAQAGHKVKDFGQGMTNVGKQLTLTVTAPLMAVGALATKTGMEFKAGMSEVQAISGATGAELQQLEAKARELGSSTKFSAKEVSDGFKYMALAGWDVQQSLDAIPGVLDLAAASGEDLALVSDILTDAISAFGDEASDAGRYADVLAAAASNANTDVAGLGEAFKYVAPVAGALGYEVEDVATALGLMANQGIKGSAMGTALRNVLTNLVSPTKAMATEMDKYGISIKDSNGEIKPLDQLLTELRGTFSNLSEDQKAQLAATLAGKEGMSGLLAIVNASDEEFNKLSDAIQNSEGVAADMAETMGDNLQGKITNLKSALEELGIKIFEALEPALTSLVEGVQKVVDWFNQTDESTQRVIVAVGLLAAALPPLLVVGGTLLTGIGSLMTFLPALVPMIAAIAAPIGLVVGAVTALGVAYALTREKADEQLVANKELAESNYEQIEAYDKVLDSIDETQQQTSELADKTLEAAQKTDELVTSFESLWEQSQLTKDEFAEFLELQSELEHTTTPSKIEELKDRMDELREKSGLTDEEFAKLISSNEQLAEMYPELANEVGEYGNAIMDTTGKIREMTQAELERAEIEVYNKMIEDMQMLQVEMENYDLLAQQTYDTEQQLLEAKEEQAKVEREIVEDKELIAEIEEQLVQNKEAMATASAEEKKQLREQKRELQEQHSETTKKLKVNEKNKKVLDEEVNTLEKSHSKLKEQRDRLGEQVGLNGQNFDKYVQIVGQLHDINFEKGKEIEQIDQIIAKNDEEIAQLEQQISLEGDANGEKQEAINKRQQENKELEQVKSNISQATGLQEQTNTTYDQGEQKIAKQRTAQQNVGTEIDINKGKGDLMNKVLGENVDKDVNIQESKDPNERNRLWGQSITKTITANVIGLGAKLFGFAKGTDYSPAGAAFLGEEGAELFRTPDGKMGIAGFGLYDLQQGTKVWTHDETKQILQNGLVDGIGRGVNATRSMDMPMPEQKHEFDIKPQPIILDGEVIGHATFDITNQQMGRQQSLDNYMKGV